MLLLCLPLALSVPPRAADVHVDAGYVGPPGDGSPGAPFLTIQEGVDAAVDGDRVVVAPGVYVENVLVVGKEVGLYAPSGPHATVIDGNALGSTLTLEDVGGAVVEGFTITGGLGRFGGGIELLGGPLPGEPVISRNIITGNSVIQIFESYYGGDGGGIDVYNADGAVIRNNLIADNTAENQGAGIHLADSSFAVVAFNTIVGNQSTAEVLGYGPGINILMGGGQQIVNNLVAYNTSATLSTGGIEVYDASPNLVANGLFQNSPADFVSTQGPLPPTNAIADPRFQDPASGDWHLRLDSPGVDLSSPSIPPGALDLDGNPRTRDADGDGSAVPDVGCYEQLGQIGTLGMFLNGQVAWTAAFEDPDAYHVFRGDAAALLAGNVGLCQDARDPVLTDTFFQEDEVPAVGEMFTFVVGFELRSAHSSLGLATSGVDRDPGDQCP
jgi:parallel beta-helix repeat protein